MSHLPNKGDQHVIASEYKETTTTYTATPAAGSAVLAGGDVSIRTSTAAAANQPLVTGDLKQTTSVASSQVGQAARADAADVKATLSSAASQVGAAASQVGSVVKADASHLASATGDALCQVREQAKQSAVETGAVVNAKLDQAAAQGELLLESAKARAAGMGTAVYAKACETVAAVAGAAESALKGAETRLDSLEHNASAKAAELRSQQATASFQQAALLEGIPAQQTTFEASSSQQGFYPAVPSVGGSQQHQTTTTTTTQATSVSSSGTAGHTQNLMD